MATPWNTLCHGKVGGARPLIEVLSWFQLSGLFLCSLTKVVCAVFPESNPSLRQILGDVMFGPWHELNISSPRSPTSTQCPDLRSALEDVTKKGTL